MAQQDDIIIIKTEESIETSILDYFLNIALVTEIDNENDLVEGKTFSEDDIDTFASLSEVAEKFITTSPIYERARDIFNQQSNNGINQSNFKRLVIIRKTAQDADFASTLNRIGYNDSYFILTNQKQDEDITSVDDWVASRRKLQFSQIDIITPEQEVDENGTPVTGADGKPVMEYDVATVLKNRKSLRTALYYHKTGTESLAGAMTSILASYPIGGKSASYKKPSGITVDDLKGSEEKTLDDKNVNYYTYYIGGAGEYSKRKLTSANGVTSSGDEIEKIIAVDRIVLSLQSALMDALEQDIPYDDNGGTIVYGKVVKVLTQLKNEGILAEDSIDDETGELDKSFTIYVPTRATLKKQYPEQFKQKAFIIKVTANLAGTGKKVYLTFAY